MIGPRIPRRVFIKSFGVALLVSGCAPALTPFAAEPTATPLPTPTPTPLPSADAVVQAYLAAWSTNSYNTMYGLLTSDSRTRLPLDRFQSYYTDTQTEATVTKVETQVGSLLHNSDQASATFRSVWQTNLFGPLTADNQMRLKFSDGRWGVEWQPTLVLPQLGEGVSLAFLSDQPTRGNIYDKSVHALATQGQMVTVGVIPQYLEEPEAVIEYISSLTKVSPDKIEAQIAAARPDWFVPVAEISFETSIENDNLLNNLAGVDRRAHEVRTYNDGETGAHIIGYMGKIPAPTKAPAAPTISKWLTLFRPEPSSRMFR
jgi:penicillin-binding protein